MKIFCDFDGTLCNVEKRHYRVYSEVTKIYGGTPLNATDYWGLKRKKTDWEEILNLSNLSALIKDEYLDKFRNLIEDLDYLKEDELFHGVREILLLLSSTNTVILVSLRRKPTNLRKQLKWLGIESCFSKVLTAHSEADGYDKKIELIKQEMDDRDAVIVGDTEADVVTGKELGMKTIAVLSGIRTRSFLESMDPDYIIDDFSKIISVLTA